MPLFIFSVLIESAYVLYRRYLVLEAKMKSLHRYKEQTDGCQRDWGERMSETGEGD